MIMSKTDAQLVAEYLDGEESALAELVARHLNSVYRFVLRMVGQAQDAEDLTQDVFVRAWKHLKKYNPKQNFRTWLLAIARNRSIDWLRKKKAIVFTDLENEETEESFVEQIIDDELLPDELVSRAQDRAFVDAMLNMLPPNYREVLLLRYAQELTFEEIGKLLGKPLDTVKSQHRRALIRLRKHWTEHNIHAHAPPAR